MPTKRVTIPINIEVDVVRKLLSQDTGIQMSYAQIFNFLIHFYKQHSAIPKTAWVTKGVKE